MYLRSLKITLSLLILCLSVWSGWYLQSLLPKESTLVTTLSDSVTTHESRSLKTTDIRSDRRFKWYNRLRFLQTLHLNARIEPETGSTEPDRSLNSEPEPTEKATEETEKEEEAQARPEEKAPEQAQQVAAEEKESEEPVALEVGDRFGPLTGIASWYGPGFNGNTTAYGKEFNENKMTAAHKSLPPGSFLQVKNLENDRTVEVEITDKGPFIGGRVLDLSKGAARELWPADKYDSRGDPPGLTEVRIKVIELGLNHR